MPSSASSRGYVAGFALPGTTPIRKTGCGLVSRKPSRSRIEARVGSLPDPLEGGVRGELRVQHARLPRDDRVVPTTSTVTSVP